MKRFFLCTVVLVVILFANTIASPYSKDFSYLNLSKISTFVSFVPSHIFVRSDQYGNIVILNTLYPNSLYVLNKKSPGKVERIPFPFSNGTLISGIDIFKTSLIFFISLNSQTSKSYAVLYDYVKQKIESIVSFDSYIEDPEFSRNGQKLAFVELTNSTTEKLVVLNLLTYKKKIISKNVVGPFVTESEIAWSNNGSICFGIKYPKQGVTYDNMGFAVAFPDNSGYKLESFYPSFSNSKCEWKNFSFPFFISNDTLEFLDGSTSTLIIFNIHTGKVVKTEKLNVSPNHLVGVQYTDGKILVISVGK